MEITRQGDAHCLWTTAGYDGFGYQVLIPPAIAARATIRTKLRRTWTPCVQGTDGAASIPRLGEISIELVNFRIRRYAPSLLDPVAAYVACVSVVAASMFITLALTRVELPSVWLLAALAGLAALAEQNSVKLSSRTEESVSLLVIVFAAVLLGPFGAMIVGAASMLGDLIPRTTVPAQYQRWMVYTATRSITGAVTGFAALTVRHTTEADFTAIVSATLAAAIVANGVDLAFGLTAHVVRRVGSPLELVRAVGPMIVASISLATPVIAALAYTFEAVSPLTLPLFLIPAVAAHRSFALYHRQRVLTDDLLAVNDRLEQASWSFASALVATLEARDEYTAGHSTAVAVYARHIAARMGLSEEEQKIAELSGLVHDIGKVGLPTGLLEKRGPLTLAERREMETHSVIGERILERFGEYGEIATIVRHHHERFDGMGYPDGLRADEIPLLARIIAVADAYDAMTSDRPYRSAMPSRVARMRLAQAVESQFDTTVVAAFEALLASGLDSGGHRRMEIVRPAATVAVAG